MDELGIAMAIDLITVLACIVLLVRLGDLQFSHPGTPYIIFHLHTVTIRLAGLLNGASTLYGNNPGYYQPITHTEIARAALYSDMAFWSVTLVWIMFRASPRAEQPERTDVIRLEPRLLKPILTVVFLAGLVGLRVAARIPGVDSFVVTDEGWSTSSYLIILPSWFGLAVLGHIYYFGSHRITSFLLAFYLILMSLQGGFRFRVIIALLLAVHIWVDRHQRRWPSRGIVIGLAAAALLFFPMKRMGSLAQEGASFSQISSAFSEEVTEASSGAAADHMFLDEFASALTLLDVQDHLYLGSIYLPLLTLPIPRMFWPEKPELAGFLKDISTRARPMSAAGMIATYLGEAYANFGLAGVILVPPIFALFLAWLRRKAYSTPFDSIWHFTYVILSVNLIQVYRDGFLSLVVFTFVNMMPLVLIVVAHLAYSVLRPRRSMPVVRPALPPMTPPPESSLSSPRTIL